MHFRFDGPVVKQLEKVFIEDWFRAGGDGLWSPTVEPISTNGNACCHVLTDSPSEDMDKSKR